MPKVIKLLTNRDIKQLKPFRKTTQSEALKGLTLDVRKYDDAFPVRGY